MVSLQISRYDTARFSPPLWQAWSPSYSNWGHTQTFDNEILKSFSDCPWETWCQVRIWAFPSSSPGKSSACKLAGDDTAWSSPPLWQAWSTPNWGPIQTFDHEILSHSQVVLEKHDVRSGLGSSNFGWWNLLFCLFFTACQVQACVANLLAAPLHAMLQRYAAQGIKISCWVTRCCHQQQNRSKSHRWRGVTRLQTLRIAASSCPFGL